MQCINDENCERINYQTNIADILMAPYFERRLKLTGFTSNFDLKPFCFSSSRQFLQRQSSKWNEI